MTSAECVHRHYIFVCYICQYLNWNTHVKDCVWRGLFWKHRRTGKRLVSAIIYIHTHGTVCRLFPLRFLVSAADCRRRACKCQQPEQVAVTCDWLVPWSHRRETVRERNFLLSCHGNRIHSHLHSQTAPWFPPVAQYCAIKTSLYQKSYHENKVWRTTRTLSVCWKKVYKKTWRKK